MIKIKTKYNLGTELKNVELAVPLDNKNINSGLYGLYSPDFAEVLNKCGKDYIPFSNDSFISLVEMISNEFNCDLVEVFNVSKGGKQVAKLKCNNNFKLNKINLEVNYYIVIPNDITYSPSVLTEFIFNNESKLIINKISSETRALNQKSFDVVVSEIRYLFDININSINNKLWKLFESKSKFNSNNVTRLISNLYNSKGNSSKGIATETLFFEYFKSYLKVFDFNTSLVLSIGAIYYQRFYSDEVDLYPYLIGASYNKMTEFLDKHLN